MMDLKMSVYSPGMELLGELETHKSIIWDTKAFTAGSFSVESLITDKTVSLLQPDNILWIEGGTAGIIEYVHQTADKTGPYITVKGCDLTGVLARRILWGLYDLSGTPPAIMHALVNDCCINPTRGDDVDARKIPGLVLLDAAPGGAAIHAQKTGGTLLEALEQLGQTYGVAFGVRFDPAAPRMEFWTRWGRDLTVHQDVKPQVFYSTELDDVLTSEYSYNAQNWRNVALVAGEGEGKDRTMVTVEAEVPEVPDIPTPPDPPKPPETSNYTVSLSVDPSGGGVASGGGTVASGKQTTVVAAPSGGYEFIGWLEDGRIISTSASFTFTVNKDRSLTAVFAVLVPKYTIVVSIGDGQSDYGTVNGGGTYEAGLEVTVTAVPADGYKFVAWQENGDAVSETEDYTFTADGNRNLIAVFELHVPKLPDGYTELEYIQIKSTAASSLSITMKKQYAIQMDVRFDFTVPTSTSFGYYTTILGRRDGSIVSNKVTNKYYGIYFVGSDLLVRGSSNSDRFKFAYPTPNNRHVLYLDQENNIAKVDGEEMALTLGSGATTGVPNLYMLGFDYISAAVTGSKGNSNGAMTLWGIKTFEADVPVFDGIPAIRTSDNKVGLFDIITQTFKAGSTSVIAGPEV